MNDRQTDAQRIAHLEASVTALGTALTLAISQLPDDRREAVMGLLLRNKSVASRLFRPKQAKRDPKDLNECLLAIVQGVAAWRDSKFKG